MHLQQTKRRSRKTGGPQYYFHSLTEPVKLFLRTKGAVQVALSTPYGATKSDFFAVGAHHKLGKEFKPMTGKVGHDRIQQGRARKSIGEAIRYWYNLPSGDFERIDLDIEIRDNVFYITPLRYKSAGNNKEHDIPRIIKPLSFTHDYQSPLWIRQLNRVEEQNKGLVAWALEEICRVVKDHMPKTKLPHIQETDILRASGSLAHFGMKLGGYVGKGYDCLTTFTFLDYPPYTIPVEVKKQSKGFHYQQRKYGKDKLSRAIVLCAMHNHKTMLPHIDVIELDALCQYASRLAL